MPKYSDVSDLLSLQLCHASSLWVQARIGPENGETGSKDSRLISFLPGQAGVTGCVEAVRRGSWGADARRVGRVAGTKNGHAAGGKRRAMAARQGDSTESRNSAQDDRGEAGHRLVATTARFRTALARTALADGARQASRRLPGGSPVHDSGYAFYLMRRRGVNEGGMGRFGQNVACLLRCRPVCAGHNREGGLRHNVSQATTSEGSTPVTMEERKWEE